MNNKNYLNIFLLLINTLLLKLTYNRTIYTCGFRNYKNFQCYDEVKKGDNNVIYLKKCESNEICQKRTCRHQSCAAEVDARRGAAPPARPRERQTRVPPASRHGEACQ